MSLTSFESRSATASSAAITSSVRSHTDAAKNLAPYVDLQQPAFTWRPVEDETARPGHGGNPVSDLIPDEVYTILRANDMINDKAVRDYIIRRAFRALREEQNYKSAEAIEKIKEIYPYLQMDTIRKIIYRINSANNRKLMF